MTLSSHVGIDLGTSSVLVYVKGKGIILREPSVVAVRNDFGDNNREIVAIGEEAYKMVGRTPRNMETIFPMREGVISNFEFTEKMLQYFLQKTVGHPLIKPAICVCIPCSITEVEQRAITEACMNIGARSVHLIEEPVAAALGAGLPIDRPDGCMVVDIGGGTADIAVISMKSMVRGASLRVAGDTFDEDIMRMLRRKYDLLIGKKTAEEIKIAIGSAEIMEDPGTMEVKGRHAITGLPAMVTISSNDVQEAVSLSVQQLCDGICRVLEQTPPELTADVVEHGILMTGGGSLLRGLDRVVARKTKIGTFVADDALSCVAIGTGRYVDELSEKMLGF
ncbi:MAG: rod shape-determining protein [Lachnospiraceae bacterium]|nr:rod shape-determining protein [Lachnospiraceae bacterium]